MPVKGNRIIYLYRPLAQATAMAASGVAFQTENERKVSRDADVTKTKDGSIRSAGEAELEITMKSLISTDDEMLPALEAASLTGEPIEVWEVNLDKPVASQTNKYQGKYYQGFITEFTMTSNSEDYAEVSMTLGINGTGAAGQCTVSAAQQALAQYAFADTTKAES